MGTDIIQILVWIAKKKKKKSEKWNLAVNSNC